MNKTRTENGLVDAVAGCNEAPCQEGRRGRARSGVRRVLTYAAGPALTLVVLLASMAACGIYPFGDHAFVARDGAIQYVGFYGWYHNVLTDGGSVCYSLSKSLGGATFGLFAYYLSSPLALLSAFFDPADSPKLFSLLAVMKLVAASFTCGFFLMKRFERESVALSLIGCAYALSAYSFTDGLNIMWLDGMALAPLVAWGVFRVVRGAGPAALFWSCAASIVCNWYIGYMTCLFAVVWFFVELALRRVGAGGKRLGVAAGAGAGGRAAAGGLGASGDLRLPSAGRVFARFCATMALAVGAGCAVLLPVAIEQITAAGIGSDSGFFATLSEGVGLLSPLALLQALVDSSASFAGATNAVAVPWALLVLVAAFFLVPGVPARAKAVLAGVVVLFVASFLFKPLDMVWTGFVRADSYNPRYYFLFLLALCVCAAWAVEALRRAPVQLRVAGTVVLAAALAVGCGRLATHGLSTTDLNGYASSSVSQYHDYMASLSQAHEQAEGASELGIVRMENAASSSVRAMRTAPAQSAVDKLSDMMTTGEYMALGDSSLSHYSSAGDGAMKELLGNLGYCLLPGSRGITTYHAPVFLADSLLGVEWVVDDDTPAGCEKISDVWLADGDGGVDAALYRNSFALGFGYAIPAAAASITWTSDPFDNQELLAALFSGKDCDGLYAAAQVDAADAAAAEQGAEAGAAAEGAGADAAQGDEGDETAHGTAVDESRSGAFRSFTVTAAASGPLYLWVASAPAGAEVSCDGESLQTTRSYESDTNIMYLGECEAGESVTVTLSVEGAAEAAFGATPVALEARPLDLARAEALLTEMRQGAFEPDVLEDGHIVGTFAGDGSTKLLLTIPATQGWKAYVDGREAEIEDVNGLIAIDAGAGEHTVELRYEAPGLAAGLALCVLSLATFSAWRAVAARRRRKSTQ